MAKKTITVCDRCEDDTVAVEDVVLPFDGAVYEGDLCQRHVDELNELLEQFRTWVKAFRVDTHGQQQPAQRRRTQQDRQENSAIRAWAQQNGLDLGARGRIPEEMRARYRQEQGREAHGRWDRAVTGGDGR